VTDLYEGFPRALLPVAIVVGIVVAVVPPATFGLMAWSRLDTVAHVLAEDAASQLSEAATRQPRLWRYAASKHISARNDRRTQSVRVVDCSGSVIWQGGDVSGPSGWAPVAVGNRIVGWVAVSVNAGEDVARTAAVALGSVLLGLLLGYLVWFLPIRIIRRQSRDLARATRAQALSRRVVDAQEEERRRMGRDLHDGLGQLLTALRFELGRAESSDRAQEICAEGLTELKRVVRDLLPADLESSSLDEALRARSERIETDTGIAVSFRHIGSRVADPVVATALLRIFQESLQNVVRHARATEVGVVLEVGHAGTSLTVFDDGQGFDQNLHAAGTGLRGMRERAELLSGTLDLQTGPEGTNVRVTIPHQSVAG
jgi:signal transduction histidine kinase